MARDLADAQLGGVAVLSIARIHGSSYGFPNPGLMPTRKEIQTCRDAVSAALEMFHRDDLPARGQVAMTRHELKQIGTVARAHGVAHIVLVVPSKPRWRLLIEGDPLRTLNRRVGEHVAVHLVKP
jgi:K+-sensing histidine kinase KdpD